MSVEAIVLAAASAIRPSTSLAALYPLLSNARPRPLLLAFVAAGLASSTTIGVLIVAVSHGVEPPRRDSNVHDVVELVAGIALLAVAIAIRSGRIGRERRGRPPGESSAIVRSLRRPTLRVAAMAGVLTHIPGLFYLVALTAIAAGEPDLGRAVLEVLAYNVIWFGVPIAALVYAGRRPEAARELMARTTEWVQRHQRSLVAALTFAVGAYLTVRGVAGLLD